MTVSTTPSIVAGKLTERAENFSEADPLFGDMLERGLTFINYLTLWDGHRAVTAEELGQQGRLGIARAAYRSLHKEEGCGG